MTTGIVSIIVALISLVSAIISRQRIVIHRVELSDDPRRLKEDGKLEPARERFSRDLGFLLAYSTMFLVSAIFATAVGAFHQGNKNLNALQVFSVFPFVLTFMPFFFFFVCSFISGARYWWGKAMGIEMQVNDPQLSSFGAFWKATGESPHDRA